jgi:hypothetical protein
MSTPRPRVWTAPAVLGFLSGLGLIAALVADGLGDLLGWLALGVPVAVVGWCWFRSRSSSTAGHDATRR